MLAGNHELLASETFNILTFYQADERSGRSHETWSGTLAPTAIDVASSRPATPVSPAAAPVPIRAPQFAGSNRATVRGY
jgi:hypothetical protein